MGCGIGGLYAGTDLVIAGRGGTVAATLVVEPGAGRVGHPCDRGRRGGRAGCGRAGVCAALAGRRNGPDHRGAGCREAAEPRAGLGRYGCAHGCPGCLDTLATFLGGPVYTEVRTTAVDAAGSVYFTGAAGKAYPVTAGPPPDPDSYSSAFVAKLTPDGSRLAYATFLGTGATGGPAPRSRRAVPRGGGRRGDEGLRRHALSHDRGRFQAVHHGGRLGGGRYLPAEARRGGNTMEWSTCLGHLNDSMPALLQSRVGFTEPAAGRGRNTYGWGVPVTRGARPANTVLPWMASRCSCRATAKA